MENVEWEKVKAQEIPVFEFENKGDHIIGVLTSKESEVGPNKSHLYTLDTKNGIFKIWGKTALDAKMDEVPEGTLIRITYLGECKSDKTKRTYKDFELEKAKNGN